MTTRRTLALGLTAVVLAALGLVSLPAQAAPAPPRLDCNVKLTMRDGTVLSANVSRPSRAGRFPTLLTTTPYGKDASAGGGGAVGGPRVPGGGCAEPGSPDTVGLARSGYAVMSVDWRGTGNSGAGKYTTPEFLTDHIDILDWIQAQPWSNGRVGATGCSNLGGSTIAIVSADQVRIREGKPRAVFAAWADSFFSDTYRAAVGPAGASTSPANFAVPALYGAGRLYANPGDHLPSDAVPMAEDADQPVYYRLADMQLDRSSYDSYWQEVDLTKWAAQVDIPLAMSGATDDLWQLGTIPLQYSLRLKKSPHPAFFMSPGGHCATTLWETLSFSGIKPGSKPALVKMWFDRWVKGIHNGIDRLPNYNLHPAGANGWVAQSASMPIRGSTMTPFYLDNAARGTVADMGTLSTRRPKAVGRDALLCAACGQGSVGAPSDALSLRYQTAPFAKDTALAGIVEGTVWATFDRDDGALSVNLLDVAPDGTATHIVDAQIRARDRVVDPRQSVYGAHGLLLDPYHPLTVAARRVVHGVDAYHLTFTPAARVIKKGHRIQARVAFTDPKFELPAPLLASLSGATMLVVHGGIQASELTLPILTGPSVEKRASFDRGRAPIDRQR